MEKQRINGLDTPKKFINHLSVCSGFEGIGQGLKAIFPNLREVAFVEREGYATANLVAKMEEGKLAEAPIHTDVKTFPFKKFLGKVDILTGGFPCTPFSQASREKKSTEDKRHLFPFILNGIKECQPELVFLENVQGIISAKTKDGESVLKYVLRSLEKVGYETTFGIFSAREVNAPHLRKRVFILSHNKGFRCRGWKSTNISDNWWFQELQVNEQSILRSEAERCSGNNGELSDTNSKRFQSTLHNNGEKRWKTEGRHSLRCSETAFPSKPNRPQHSWEEPRVKPKLGRTANGSNCRVDRLRLLGNGVLPQTAERAFRVLSSRLT